MKPTFWLVLAALLFTPFGFIAFGILMKLGIESSLEKYGTAGTIGLVAAIVPCLVALGFLIDKREGRI